MQPANQSPDRTAEAASATSDEFGTIDRRGFMKVAVAAAAAGGLGAAGGAGAAVAQEARPPQQQQPEPILPALGNGDPPALQFQAYPGGTGSYLEKLARERGRAAFDRATFDVDPWTGAVPASEEEIAFLPVHRLAALVKARKLSPVTLTEIYLDRLERFDPILLCAVTIMRGQALEAAQQAEAEIRNGHYRGPLHGIPWGVKDLFATRGARTTWGARDFENQIVDQDAEVVVRLREAGAVLIAKLATGQFASGDNWYRGQTKNPWNTAQGSSGSSAGPASATAAACVAFGIGTETQGSIVSPSIRCGLSALRPTFGRVSRYGGMVLAWSMDKIGPICRTIEDCALIFNVIHGADEKDPATVTAPFQFERNPDLAKLRIGYDERAPAEFIAKLRELGADPRPIGARPDSRGVTSLGVESAAAFDYYVATLPPLPPDSAAELAAAPAAGARAAAPPGGAAGAGAGGAPAAGGRGGGGGGGRARFTRGRTVTALEFLQSQRRRLILMRQMAELMKDLDMYVSGSGDVGLTNQTGHPAAVVPYAFREGENPQPLCTTIIGNLFADDRILSVAHAYQTATDWHLRRPKLVV
jgi:Asp-tRNA(Asn)/Glu-tRNA(Gln) amidotransferase A subunit family amidase